MCARPDAFEYLRDVSRVMEILREDTSVANPAHEFAWVGARVFYGLLESV